jgi:chromosome segregation ATPase
MSSVEITDAFALRLAFLICSTLLTLLDHCNIVRNMSLHETRRTNSVLSELLIWTKYLQYALQRMYDVANEIDEEKEAFKEDLAAVEATLATNDAELQEAHEEVSRVRHEQQLLQPQVADQSIPH